MARASALTASRILTAWPIAAATVLVLAVWQTSVTLFAIPPYIAPTPIAVAVTFVEERALLWDNLWPTVIEAVLGFALGNIAAVLLAVWFVHSHAAMRVAFPIAAFVNTIPIIAVAPILVLIFGYGMTPKIIVAALICFFPTLVNMVRGLNAVSTDMLDLMRVLSASDREILFKVRLQGALPYLFAALRVAATTCVIGAIIGEWIGATRGLGALIIEATHNFRSPLLYASVILASSVAVAFFALINFAERKVIGWKTQETP